MQFEQTLLSGGLMVITHSSPHLESVSLGAFVNAGSRQETALNHGVAHFLEHLLFKGTQNRTANEIATQIEVLGSDINAFTSTDMTAVHATGLASHGGQSIEIIGDMITHSLFASPDIGLESGVILQEISRNADSPNNVMHDVIQAVSYPGQSLGRTILGSTEFVAHAVTEDFHDFTTRQYTADNIVIAGAGGIDHDVFVRNVEAAFVDLPRTVRRQPIPRAAYVGGIGIDRNRDFKQVSAGIAFDSVPIIDDTMYHHILLADAFGGGMSSPLFNEVREKRGLVYSTGCHTSMGADNGRLLITGGMTAENVEEFVVVACRAFRTMCDHVDAIDLRRAKNSYLVGLATLRERPYAAACFMARSYWQRGRVRSLAEMRDAINAVTLNDLKAAAARVLTSEPSIALIGPAPQADYKALVCSA